MALGDVIATLAAKLVLDTAAFEQGATLAEKRFEQSRKRFESIGKSMAGIGVKMSAAFTVPLVALGKASYDAAKESADALGQVKSALASMGDASGRTVEQLQKLAETQMGQSLYDDDEILRKVTANLLTFGKISGTAFDQAQQAAIDLSARLGQDLQSSAVMVGKALNDPIRGVTALSRVGVSFTEAQKQQIKAMTEAGDVAGAQALILGELQKQYSGAAAAARAADPTAASKQAWADFQETIGAFIMKALPPLTDFLAKLLNMFNDLSPGMQKVVVVGGAILAALGPVLGVLGGIVTVGAPLLAFFTAVAPAIAAMSAALLPLILNPVFLGLAATLVGIYLAWKHWDEITAIVRNLYNGVKTWIMDKLGAVWDWLKGKIDFVKGLFHGLYDAVVGHSYIPDMVDGIAAQMARLDAVMVAPAKKATSAAEQAFKAMAGNVRQLLDELFPEAAGKRAYLDKQTLLGRAEKAGQLTADEAFAARQRLASNYAASLPGRPTFAFGQEPLSETTQGIDKLAAQMGKLADKAGVTTVRIAKSFKDMADETLGSLSNLANAIKGGGFLDILQAVVGLGLQLGSIGTFGKKIAANINRSVPAYATGTSFHPGGLALVGERGPELVSMPRGSRVTPNGDWGGSRVEIVPSPYFDVVVDGRVAQAAPGIASAGAQGGVAQMSYRQSRQWR